MMIIQRGGIHSLIGVYGILLDESCGIQIRGKMLDKSTITTCLAILIV